MPEGPFKVVRLEECLRADTLVTILRHGLSQKIKISELNDESDLVFSYNIETDKCCWMPFTLKSQGIRKLKKIVFANGQTVFCTSNHKWFVRDKDKILVVRTDELKKWMHVLSPINRLSINGDTGHD
jgi:intein/homing endonuclease